tara:strand:+ start:521 stop:784 length:264 start_codon:yes stop_codon:yes gene_type:complete
MKNQEMFLSYGILFTCVIMLFVITSFIAFTFDKKLDPVITLCVLMILSSLALLFSLGGLVIVGKIWLIIMIVLTIMAVMKYIKDKYT